MNALLHPAQVENWMKFYVTHCRTYESPWDEKFPAKRFSFRAKGGRNFKIPPTASSIFELPEKKSFGDFSFLVLLICFICLYCRLKILCGIKKKYMFKPMKNQKRRFIKIKKNLLLLLLLSETRTMQIKYFLLVFIKISLFVSLFVSLVFIKISFIYFSQRKFLVKMCNTFFFLF